jgi:hypothetical protein
MDASARLQIILPPREPLQRSSHSEFPLKADDLIVQTRSVMEPQAVCSRAVRRLRHPVVPRMFPRAQ